MGRPSATEFVSPPASGGSVSSSSWSAWLNLGQVISSGLSFVGFGEIGWTETIGNGTDGHGGTYHWDDLETWDSGTFTTIDHIIILNTETCTIHDLGGAVTEDEVFHASGSQDALNQVDQNVITDHATTSDTINFEDKGTAPVATGRATGDDNFDNIQTSSATTDYTCNATGPGSGGGLGNATSTTSENDQGWEKDSTHDNGGDSLSGATSGSDTFTADTGDSDNWTHVASSNATEVSGNTSGSSTVSDTVMGTDSSDDGVIGTDSFSAGTSGGTDNFNDSEDSSDKYNLSFTTSTNFAPGVGSGSTSATLTASGGGGASDDDKGTDSNSNGSSDNFDGAFGDDENWTANETAFSSYDGLGGTTSGGSADDTDSDTATFSDNGGDSGLIADTFTHSNTLTSKYTDTGSWSIATSPGGTTTSSGGLTYDDKTSDEESDSDNGSDTGKGFDQVGTSFAESDISGTNNIDGSDTYTVSADGKDSSTFDLSGPDGNGSATLDELGSDHWSSTISGADATNGSGSATFSASDGGADSITDNGSGTATTPISGGAKTDGVTLDESSSDKYGDTISGSESIDASDHVSGNESYSSSDSGQDQLTLTDTGNAENNNPIYFPPETTIPVNIGGTGSDSYSLHGTVGDSYTLTDAGSVSVGPSGTTGSDTLTNHVTGGDSFGGTDAAVVTTSDGTADDINLSFSGSDAETVDETITTTKSGGATTTSASGTDTGTDTFDLANSDATNNYTEDDSDSYNDPIGGSGTAASPSAPTPNAAAFGIQPAGAPGDTSSMKRTGPPPGGYESPTWSAVGGFFGNLWDRATYVPKTVWANTGGSDSSLAGRIYVTAGTTVGSLVGVTQVSDAFAKHDAVDGHEQTTGERIVKGISGTVQLATVGASAAGKVTTAIIPTKASIPPSQALLNQGTARGSELANPALLDKLRARGFVVEQSEDVLQYLNFRQANAATFLNKDILLRPDPRKIEVLEEFLHNVQNKIGLTGKLTPAQLETHVKSFMIRHKDLLGITEPDDVKWLLNWLANSGG